MGRQELAGLLQGSHQKFADYLSGLSEEQFNLSKNGKWTAGQELQHIILSAKPMIKALSLPADELRARFGTAINPSRTYTETVTFYKSKLGNGVEAPPRFTPSTVTFDQRTGLINELNQIVDAICKGTVSREESELDSLLIPHPLLGPLTMREMLYFTAYHAEHHLNNSKRNLSGI
ncbi:MAG: DinB family protein [Bacteroidetes bacterium]|nr:DinB family protein [Bacteroidota bacterium]